MGKCSGHTWIESCPIGTHHTSPALIMPTGLRQTEQHKASRLCRAAPRPSRLTLAHYSLRAPSFLDIYNIISLIRLSKNEGYRCRCRCDGVKIAEICRALVYFFKRKQPKAPFRGPSRKTLLSGTGYVQKYPRWIRNIRNRWKLLIYQPVLYAALMEGL